MVKVKRLKEKCVFCGQNIDPKNFVSFKARGKEKFSCPMCYAENKEAINYMIAIEGLTIKYGEVVTLAGGTGPELLPLDMKKEKKVT